LSSVDRSSFLERERNTQLIENLKQTSKYVQESLIFKIGGNKIDPLNRKLNALTLELYATQNEITVLKSEQKLIQDSISNIT